MSDPPSRQTIAAALELPTRIIREEIDITQCAHAGRFQREDEDCITCYSTPECEWLIRHDDRARTDTLSRSQLMAALQFASDYMHARLVLGRHAPQECPCDQCHWWRGAQDLLRAAGLGLAF